MRIALYAWRVTWRRSWQTAAVVMLMGALLGAMAMAALAGARRTDSAYGRYLQSVKASDLMIDIPGPLLFLVRDVEHLPGKVSSAAWLGLNGEPIFNGKVDPSFQADGIAVSFDGEYFRQDKLTVLAGKLPAIDSTNQMAVTQPMAREFHLHVGSHLTWQFTRSEVNAQGFPVPGKAHDGVYEPGQRITFDITANGVQQCAGDSGATTDGFCNVGASEAHASGGLMGSPGFDPSQTPGTHVLASAAARGISSRRSGSRLRRSRRSGSAGGASSAARSAATGRSSRPSRRPTSPRTSAGSPATSRTSPFPRRD